ncbi:hypothetical protein ABFS82_08G188100 [Erythranthe guttata]|uniref:Uncharacterized protein n=1 Tax=Erythranthe guttata TaxID=4155 RepID=A0A022QEG9_ERYGU|nr:PREDICTED: uncharacterized protein LOC105970454 [Erythranthe guttata]EYU26356.1 hypothetical protein MIMGU_mgv1a010685mg [Erythranthe guttata]|eukprot:XP_012850731.1 PREDICTED: uncharacterized protein LOC105970454 [Erythranthe guttata]
MDVNNEDIEKVEPGELLEDIWFFGNLLQRKSRMLRSLSDPCTSSFSSSSKVYGGQEEASPEKSYEETYESIKKLSAGDEPPRRSLIRAPSDPSSSARKDQKPAKKGGDSLRGKSSNRRRAPANALNRAPSLPTSLQETDEEENEFSMGKLIRQASMNYSDTLPPRKHAAKALTPSSSVSRYRSTRKKSEVEGIKFDLESEELLRGFNDLRLDSGGKDSSPNPISIAPGLQERKRVDEEEDEVVKHSRAMRPYLSEAWAAAPKQSSAPPFPKWGGGGGKAKRSNEDVKAQIKFWARAVASNVRQEC